MPVLAQIIIQQVMLICVSKDGFCKGQALGSLCGILLLQTGPFSHFVLEYFSGNEVTIHKEAKH